MNLDSRWPSGTSLCVYDALIAASALLAECDRLWSEEMAGSNGDRQADVRIVNPFARPADDVAD